MRNFLEKRDPWGHGMALWVLMAMVFAAPLALLALQGLHLENDVEAWLPENDPDGRVYSWFSERFPASQPVIVTWEGSTLSDPRIGEFAENLRGRVDEDGQRRGGVPYISAVTTPHDLLAQMTAEGIAPDEALRQLQGVLIGAGSLKLRLTNAGRENQASTLARLTAAAGEKLGLELKAYEPVENFTSADSSDVGEALTLEVPPHDVQIGWDGFRPQSRQTEAVRRLALTLTDFATIAEPEGRRLVAECFIAPGSPLAIGLELSEAGAADLPSSIDAIRHAAVSAGVPPQALHLGGRAVALVELNSAVKRAAWNPDTPRHKLSRRSVLLFSGLASIVLAMFLLRSLRLGALVVGVSYYAALLGVSLIPLTGTSMNLVLTVLPTLLMVLAMSTAMHVANAWRIAAGDNSRVDLPRAAQLARRPCLIAGLITAGSLLSLLASSMQPVRQFGGYAAAGCLIGLVVVLYGLPALLQITRLRMPAGGELSERRWTFLGDLLARRPWLTSAVCGLLLIGGAAGLSRLQLETKVVRTFPADSRLIQDDHFIEENLAGVTPIDLVIRFSPETQDRLRFLQRLDIVRAVEQRVREHSEISGALSLADFIEPEPALATDASSRARNLYARRSNEVEARIKRGDNARAAAYLAMAAEPADRSPSGDPGLHRAGDELWRITAHASLLSDMDYRQLSQELSETVQAVTRFHAGADHVITGQAPVFDRTQRAMLKSLTLCFTLALFAIGAALCWMLKNPLAALLCCLSNVLPLACVFGVAAWCGERIDVGALITVSVALLLAAHGTLHLVMRFRDGLRRGCSRRRAAIETTAHCGPAIWQTGVAVGVGVLMLVPSDLSLISRFGWLTAAQIAAALFANLVLFPALLAGPLGALLERSVPVRLAIEDTPVAERTAAPHVRFEPGQREVVRPAV